MSLDFAKEGYVPNSVTVFNNVQVRMGGPEHVIAQLRVEVLQDGGQYSLQTGAISPGDTKAVFFKFDSSVTLKVVIEVNHVSSWVNYKWDVAYTGELAEGSYTFVVDGTPEEIVVRPFRK